jgi:hypothetical protein
MTMVTTDQIMLSRIQAEPWKVRMLTALSRDILHDNGNKAWNDPIKIITDDFELARDSLDVETLPINDGDFAGYCWGNDGNRVIWVKPQGGIWIPKSPYGNDAHHAEVKTLCHEVTHALTSNVNHNFTFRRAHALLLPFWLYVLHNPIIDWGELQSDVKQIITRYRRKFHSMTDREYIHGCENELNHHIRAVHKIWVRWSSRVI